MSEIAQKGEFLPPVVKSHAFGIATLSSYIAKGPDSPMPPHEYREIFSRRHQKGSVYVDWTPQTKQKVTCELRLFNLDNKLLIASKPKELSLNPGKYMATTWEVPVGNMLAGIYRADLALSDQTVWRQFFRVTD